MHSQKRFSVLHQVYHNNYETEPKNGTATNEEEVPVIVYPPVWFREWSAEMIVLPGLQIVHRVKLKTVSLL